MFSFAYISGYILLVFSGYKFCFMSFSFIYILDVTPLCPNVALTLAFWWEVSHEYNYSVCHVFCFSHLLLRFVTLLISFQQFDYGVSRCVFLYILTCIKFLHTGSLVLWVVLFCQFWKGFCRISSSISSASFFLPEFWVSIYTYVKLFDAVLQILKFLFSVASRLSENFIDLIQFKGN